MFVGLQAHSRQCFDAIASVWALSMHGLLNTSIIEQSNEDAQQNA